MLRTLTRTVLLFALFGALAHGQALIGTWSHVADSDGTKPQKGKALSLTFDANGKCHLKATDATGKENTVNGDGTYSISSGRLTLSLPVLELKLAAKPYTLTSDRLTLPFLLFNEGAGTSEWVRATASPAPSPSPISPPTPQTNAMVNNSAMPRPTPTGGMKNELLCTCNKQSYDTPRECLGGCTGRVGLAGTAMCGSVLQSQERQPCPVLRNPAFKTIYDQVVLHHFGPLAALPSGSSDTPNNPNVILIGNLINTFYKPWSVSDYFIAIAVGTGGGTGGELAHVEPANGGKIYLRVGGAAIESSPGSLVGIIGHEMIHGEQFRRGLKQYSLPGFNSFTHAMNELEAWSWQTGTPMNFRWKIAANQAWKCETQDEQDKDMAVRECREWQVRETLVKVNTRDDRHELQNAVDNWINENPWARTVWLPYNRNWKGVTSNNLRSQVPYAHDPDHGIDCHQGME